MNPVGTLVLAAVFLGIFTFMLVTVIEDIRDLAFLQGRGELPDFVGKVVEEYVWVRAQLGI